MAPLGRGRFDVWSGGVENVSRGHIFGKIKHRAVGLSCLETHKMFLCAPCTHLREPPIHYPTHNNLNPASLMLIVNPDLT